MDFDALFSGFNSKKVLVVGDAMIDAYMWGEINRMSPEAPVPVVEVKKHENRLGGAANVALNLQSMGATPILCSVIGNDSQSILFKELIQNANLSNKGLLTSKERRTTLKTRVIAENKHQLRIDEEDTHPITCETEFLNLIQELIADVDVVILQDYNKGVLTAKVIAKVIEIANTKNIPTIVDPKKQNFLAYKNCTIFKPNLAEIKAGMNIDFNPDITQEIEKAAADLRELLNAKGVLLTLSGRGICINTKENFTHTPAFKRNIIDVSGAGDTVIAVAALCLASNMDFINLSLLSSLAGGMVCEEVGVVPIQKEKLLIEAKKSIV
ncbi:MAG: D-glycero-beta-D-manno-heptose-7-phosphate kinase [Cryomorphaceae bacterium]|nr:D-glycero-beta-D-manno-heptose-7-phosphate kinase [Cryomorphaceae bacterium]